MPLLPPRYEVVNLDGGELYWVNGEVQLDGLSGIVFLNNTKYFSCRRCDPILRDRRMSGIVIRACLVKNEKKRGLGALHVPRPDGERVGSLVLLG